MPPVVQAVCPGCKKVLRIPPDWVDQPIKCKHCGLVLQARAKPPGARTPIPAAPPSRPAAPAAAASPFAGLGTPAASPTAEKAAGSPFNFDDTGTQSRRRRRRGGGILIGAVLGACLVVLTVAGAVAFWPRLSALWNEVRQTSVAENKEPDGEMPATDSAKPEAADRPKSDLPVKPKAEAPPSKTEDRPRRPSGSDLPVASGPFPRRALLINVTGYIYANPITTGTPSRDVHALAKALSPGLRIPDKQVFELNDAAREIARAPLKPVIEQTITEFLATSRAQDRVLVLFVGHAVEIGDEAFLVPVEAEVDNKDALIPLAWLYKRLEECKARQKLLALDVCRYNPTRGMERPGSGIMGAKLDALLQKPPPGVQVWSACVRDQYSYEFEDGIISNGLFLDTLIDVLGPNASGGTIQKPEDPLPLEALIGKVNAVMKRELDRRSKVQTSRLSGKEPDTGASPDPKEPAAARVEIPKPPAPEGGAAPFDLVTGILREVQVPPVKRALGSRPDFRWEVLPPFSAKVLEAYKDDGGSTPLRDAVKKARDLLVNKAAEAEGLQIEFRAPVKEMAFKNEIRRIQEDRVAKYILHLNEARQELKGAEAERGKESSKRWQANFDYLRARIEAQFAYTMEYTSLLGQMRKDLPERDPRIHNGWRLASQEKLQGDSDGKKAAQEARKLLDKLAKEHPGTPWEVLAKRDRLTALGLEWQPAKLGAE